MSQDYQKNKKTLLHFGSSAPATATLAGAITAAVTGFGCLVDTMNGLDLTRGTIDDPKVYCNDPDSFQHKDTDELQISNYVVEGMVDADGASGYDEVKALAETMIKADTNGVMVITEPNGIDKLWLRIKFVKVAKLRGGAQDKQRFALEVVAMTMPKAA